MIVGLVLASGASRRMGRDKLLLPFRGETILEHSVRSLFVSEIEEVLVVTGPGRDYPVPAAQGTQVRVIENHEFGEGLAASVRRGTEEVINGGGCEALCVQLGDKPILKTGTVRSAILAFRKYRPEMLVSRFNGSAGHPVILSSSLFDRLLELRGDGGARALASSAVSHYLDTEDPGVVFDIDTDGDYTRLLEYE